RASSDEMWLKHALTRKNLGEVRARRPAVRKNTGESHNPSGFYSASNEMLLSGRYSRAVVMRLLSRSAADTTTRTSDCHWQVHFTGFHFEVSTHFIWSLRNAKGSGGF